MYPQETLDLAADLVAACQTQDVLIATAESCTGGKVGGLLTDVSGSSRVYHEGVVAYSNDVKMKRLGVKLETLEAHGAVSEAVVLEMARGIRAYTGATYGLSISGIAGPTGGTPDKPVGTVFLAFHSGESLRSATFPAKQSFGNLDFFYSTRKLEG